MWNLKYDTNELIYKTQTDSQTQRINLWLARSRAGGGRMAWEAAVSTDKLLYMEGITTRSYCTAQRTIFNTLL